MMWHVVLRFSSHLSFEFREVFKDYRKAISGTTAEDPRWQDCLGVVDGSFGMPFGLLFVDETFEGESKKSVGNRHSVKFCLEALGLYSLKGKLISRIFQYPSYSDRFWGLQAFTNVTR